MGERRSDGAQDPQLVVILPIVRLVGAGEMAHDREDVETIVAVLKANGLMDADAPVRK